MDLSAQDTIQVAQMPYNELMEVARHQRQITWEEGLQDAAQCISELMAENERLRAERDAFEKLHREAERRFVEAHESEDALRSTLSGVIAEMTDRANYDFNMTARAKELILAWVAQLKRLQGEKS